MPVNIGAIEAQHQRVEIIHMAIRAADKMGGSTYLDLDGERQLLTLPELNKRYDEEEAKLRALGPEF